jgi:hypothetical protein
MFIRGKPFDCGFGSNDSSAGDKKVTAAENKPGRGLHSYGVSGFGAKLNHHVVVLGLNETAVGIVRAYNFSVPGIRARCDKRGASFFRVHMWMRGRYADATFL